MAVPSSFIQIIALAIALIPASHSAPYDDIKARDIMVYASAAYCPKGKVNSWTMDGQCATRTSAFDEIQSIVATPPDLKMTRQYFGFMGVDKQRQWVVASFKGHTNNLHGVVHFDH